jgi:hypothetical protein
MPTIVREGKSNALGSRRLFSALRAFRRGDFTARRSRLYRGYACRRALSAKPAHEIGRRHHADDRAPMRPSHCRYARDAGHAGLFNERVDRRRKAVLVPGGFRVRSRDVEALRDRDDHVVFRDIGALGEECARNVAMKASGSVVAFFEAHELGRLKRETRVDVTLGRVDWKPDFSSQTLEPRANPRPVLRRKRLRCPFGRRLRMDLKGKPTQISLQFSPSFFGPN